MSEETYFEVTDGTWRTVCCGEPGACTCRPRDLAELAAMNEYEPLDPWDLESLQAEDPVPVGEHEPPDPWNLADLDQARQAGGGVR